MALLAGLAANFILTLIAYTCLTPGFVSWRAAWPGALVAATLSQGYVLIFPLYVRYVLYPNHFGSIAGFALVALVFFYAYSLFIVIGAEIAALCAGYQPSALDLTGIIAHAARTPWPRRRVHQADVTLAHIAPPTTLPSPTTPATLDDVPTDPRLTTVRR
jgi:uncharacterized BrkB/YihY/UPF0761 family membrane protein